MSMPPSPYIRRHHPVWRWMILFGCITFLLSLVLIKAVAPLGDAILASHEKADSKQQDVRKVSEPATAPAAPAVADRL